MREEQKFEMAGDENSCPKCGLEAKSMLHRFCQHSPCPVRDLLGLKKQEGMVVDAMLNQPKKTEAEYGWVIERGDSPVSAPLYFMAITGKKETAWSVHHLSAVRFCRKEDAESVLPFLGSGHRVCEHEWCNI